MIELAATAALNVVYVAYENLSSDAMTAEFQKDVLLQVLRDEFKSAETFVEQTQTQKFSPSAHDSLLTIRCQSCGFATDTTLFVRGTISKQTQLGPNVQDFSFKVQNPDQKPQSWKVTLTKGAKRFFVATKSGLPSDMPIISNQFEVLPCAPTTPCRADNSFESESLARKKISELEGARARRSLPAGTALTGTDFLSTTVVRTNDPVRVTFKSATGLKVSTRARALQSGNKGSSIRVELKNPFANGNGEVSPGHSKIIDAVVVASGEVEYGL